jgi:hypothetical protein
MLGVETLETSQKADGSHGEGKLELAMALSTKWKLRPVYQGRRRLETFVAGDVGVTIQRR